MKNYKIKYAVLVGLLLCKSGSFGASEATKRLIQKTLAKYGISSGGKEVCGTGREPDYNNGNVKCKNDQQGDSNNCWDASSRLCKTCPYKTIVSQRDFITCRQIICPDGYELVEVKNGECPDGFELKPVVINSCGTNADPYTEIQATNKYTTSATNCNNIN